MSRSDPFTPMCRGLVRGTGKLVPPLRVHVRDWLRLAALAATLTLLFFPLIRLQEGKRSVRAPTLEKVGPATQIASLHRQDAFCRDLYAHRPEPEPPTLVKLAWTEEEQPGKLQLTYVPDGGLPAGSSAAFGLLRVDGLRPPAPSAAEQPEPYSIYVLAPQAGLHDFVSSSIKTQKAWEAADIVEHVAHLESLAKELGVPRHEVFFVDVGAQIGTFSLAVAAAGFSVISIEAMAVNQYAMQLSLCANLRLAPHFTLIPVALGREVGRCGLYSEPRNVLDGNIWCDEAAAAAAPSYVRQQDVDISRLDDVLADWMPALAGRVGALKMDTEGFEPWVVEGAQRFFRSVRPRFVQAEVSAMSQKSTNVTGTELMKELEGMGYEVRLAAGGPRVDPMNVTMPPSSIPTNVYFVAVPSDTPFAKS